jgi:ribosomal protein L2
MVGKLNTAGKSNSGSIIINHRGNGKKKNLALIDFKRK